jgi:phosphatidylserine decarboxylase
MNGMGVRRLAAKTFVRAVSHPHISRPAAWLADSHAPGPLLRSAIRAYIRAYHVDMSEVAEPITSFASFNAFFTRKLRDGARPVDGGAGVIVSPCDSQLAASGAIGPDARIEQVKGHTYTVAALLGHEKEALPFAQGVYATLYLSPSMYHRVHFPVDGKVRSWRYVPGRLYPVNSIAVRHVPELFAVNERVAVHIDTEQFGPVVAVMVGATNVGRITLSFTDLMTNRGQPAARVEAPTPIPVRRGDELGAFNLGSTVVLLAADPNLELARPRDTILKMGEPLWRRP